VAGDDPNEEAPPKRLVGKEGVQFKCFAEKADKFHGRQIGAEGGYNKTWGERKLKEEKKDAGPPPSRRVKKRTKVGSLRVEEGKNPTSKKGKARGPAREKKGRLREPILKMQLVLWEG